MIPDEERDYFRRGKEVLGQSAGSMLARLLKARHGCVPLARAIIETASTKENPREYVARIIGTKPAVTGSDGFGYARSFWIRAKAQLDYEPMDRSDRPTYEELQEKHGPNWGLRERDPNDWRERHWDDQPWQRWP